MKVTSLAAAAICAALSNLTVGVCVAGAEPVVSQSEPVHASPRPAGIGWSWDWDDDDDDWSQTATWECPAGCSITFEDDY
jgi:hypothetical protein